MEKSTWGRVLYLTWKGSSVENLSYYLGRCPLNPGQLRHGVSKRKDPVWSRRVTRGRDL